METYYVSAYATYVRDYKVQAESKEEAIEIVQEGSVDHYDDDFLGLEVDKDGVQTIEEENSCLNTLSKSIQFYTKKLKLIHEKKQKKLL